MRLQAGGLLTPTGSEFYIISNPCEGLHLQGAQQLGIERCAKPQRRYDALQMEFDTRFVSNLSLNINYTFSRLYGNYSGLASSDEPSAIGTGRLSPGVNRFFDLPFVGFTASGQPDNGRLATDRTSLRLRELTRSIGSEATRPRPICRSSRPTSRARR